MDLDATARFVDDGDWDLHVQTQPRRHDEAVVADSDQSSGTMTTLPLTMPASRSRIASLARASG